MWCPDWPLTAAGVAPDQPAIVLAGGGVAVCSGAARAAGVRVGLRQREAQARCPALTLVDADPGRDARAFEPVVAAIQDVVPALEVVRPGLLALAVRGPARVFDGEEPVATQLLAAASREIPGPQQAGRVGVADGRFAATLAARGASPLLIVPAGQTPAFLAPLPVTALTLAPPHPAGDDVTELVALLRRLGIRTLGDLAALPATAVLDRFGRLGQQAHRLARGDDGHRLDARPPPPELAVATELDPPAARIDVAAFAARGLADELVTLLRRRTLTCTVVAIEAQTEHGEQLSRRWRHHPGFTAAALADRVRWQLDGWLAGTVPEERPSAGISRLRLVPVEAVPDGHQPDMWGGPSDADRRVARALTRLQGRLGPAAVVTAVPAGGREPATWIVPARWGEAAPAQGERGPWPGRLPPPAPATTLPDPLPAVVVDADGAAVGVSGRGVVTAPPGRVRVDGGPWRDVAGWAGPWPADERWWDAGRHRRRARFQITTADGAAYLLVCSGGRWHAEAIYD